MFCAGIGASAGGLEALREFCSNLEQHENITYIVAQHLSPTRDSMLTELLSRHCKLELVEARNGDRPQPGYIYITPPNCDIEVNAEGIQLSEPRSGPLPKPDINRLFYSLSEQYGDHAIGVILSGTGTDGTSGLGEIKASAGVTMVQDPGTAQYDGMPLNSIRADYADFILSPKEIANKLQEVCSIGSQLRLIEHDQAIGVFRKIVELLRQRSGVDLTHYRRSSAERRILRRMSICNINQLEDYLELLESDSEEVDKLANEAFVNVTEFFRNPEAFDELAQQLEPLLQKTVEQDRTFRVWVPGCSTGEEVYSIAMVLEEYQRRSGNRINYRIFATDISQKPLALARLGVYSDTAVAALDEDIVQRYFETTVDGYRVVRRARDNVIFSNLDLVKDAPFSKLDLISCRNLLIYFDQSLQRQSLETFHYALNEHGLLFLGMSENTSSAKNLFSVVSAKYHLYQWQSAPGHRDRLPQFLLDTRRSSSLNERSPAEQIDPIEIRLKQLLFDHYANASIVINQNDEIVYSAGDLTEIVLFRSGPATMDFINLVREDIRTSLRALMLKIRRKQAESEQPYNQFILLPASQQKILISAMLFDPMRPDWLYLSFRLKSLTKSESDDSPDFIDEDEEQTFKTLELELLSTRENLQAVVEELELSNERLQAANEELQSSNEEFQSTNEELQTTNEELQSSNEELLTLNDELQEKSLQHVELFTEYENIKRSIDSPFIVVNKELRVSRFIPMIDNLIEINSIRERDHISSLAWREEIPGLIDNLEETILTRRTHQEYLQLSNKIWNFRITPFIDSDGKVSGAILFFLDTTELFRTRENFRQEKERSEITLNSVADGIICTGIDGTITYLNPAASTLTGSTNRGVIGLPLEEVLVFDSESDKPPSNLALMHLSGQTLESNLDRALDPEINIHKIHTQSGMDRYISFSINSTTNKAGMQDGTVITIHDMTDRYASLSELSWMSKHDDLTKASNRRETESRIRSIIKAIRGGRKSVAAFLYMDLDQFKVINDTSGHAAGDALLQEVSQLLGKHIRRRDTLSRLGGDEFGIILEDCPIAEAEVIAENIRGDIEEYKFFWKDSVFRIGISIGVVEVNNDTREISEVFSRADTACYAAKELGRNRVYVHSDDDEDLERKRRELNWATRIQSAIEQNRFILYAQEIRSTSNPDCSRWEILLRMHGQNGELILPRNFLPAAERYALMQQLDEWVIENLFALLGRIDATKLDSMPSISINLSGASFTDDKIARHVQESIEKYQIEPHRLTFEITESSAIGNFNTAVKFIDQIRHIGCQVALDDFGKGMSSYSYLQNLNIDYLKIDGSFIRKISESDFNEALVRSMVEIADTLGIETVAEYVESDSIKQSVTKLGVDWLQGNQIGIPMPIDHIFALDFTPSPIRHEHK